MSSLDNRRPGPTHVRAGQLMRARHPTQTGGHRNYVPDDHQLVMRGIVQERHKRGRRRRALCWSSFPRP